MQKKSLYFLILIICGCTHYKWHHTENRNFASDYFTCGVDAENAVRHAIDQVHFFNRPGFDRSKCYDGSYRAQNIDACYRPQNKYELDVRDTGNIYHSRQLLINQCLRQHGWYLNEEKKKESYMLPK